VNAPTFCALFGALAVGTYACTDTILVRHADGSCERVPLPTYALSTGCGLTGAGTLADPLKVTVRTPAEYAARGFQGNEINDNGLWCAPDGSVRPLPEHYHVYDADLNCYNPSVFGPFTNGQVLATGAVVSVTNLSAHRAMYVHVSTRGGDWIRNIGPNRNWLLKVEVSTNGGPFTSAGYMSSRGNSATTAFSERLGNAVTVDRATLIPAGATHTVQGRVIIELDSGTTDGTDFVSTGCLDVIISGSTV
jgi:hypothetical protein